MLLTYDVFNITIARRRAKKRQPAEINPYGLPDQAQVQLDWP